MSRAHIYSVPSGGETPDEPRAGVYWSGADGAIHGPYRTIYDAEEAAAEAARNQEDGDEGGDLDDAIEANGDRFTL